MYKPQHSGVHSTTKFRVVNVLVPIIFNEADLAEKESVPEEYLLSEDELEIRSRREAFEKEALPHFSVLRNSVNRMLRNKLDADDILQETYLRAFRFFNSFEKGTNCKAWLFRIMKNLIINKYRKEIKKAEIIRYDDVENFISDIKSNQFDIENVEQKIFSKLLDDELIKALNSIGDDYKMAVILCDLEGFSYEEIAEFLHCPIGSVRSQLHRGRKLLQRKLFYYAKQRGYNVSETSYSNK